MKFKCTTCGEEHDLDEISFFADRPRQWDLLSDAEKEASDLGQELCIINASEGRSYYLRACLEIPIRGTAKSFTWGVWVSLSQKSFDEVSRTWDDPNRTTLGPYFGWFCISIPGYPDTMYLKTMVHNREVGQRPTIELEPSEHPLSQHQQHGIPEDEMASLAREILHSQA